MSIYNKSVSDIQTGDLEELLSEGAVENIRLEFKSEAPKKEELLKKLSSFANTFGGLLIVGAKANSSDSRLVGLPGIEAENSYKQKVTQWCFDGASPPLTVDVSDPIPASSPDGRVCYAIRVIESDLGPHFINGRGGAWVRTDEISQHWRPQLATEGEIGHLMHRRRVVEERRTALLYRSRQRFANWLSSDAPEVASKRSPSRARVEFSIGPRFPATQLWSPSRVLQLFRENRVSRRGTMFPYDKDHIVTQHESVLALTPRREGVRCAMTEATVWGVLFYGTELDLEVRSSDGPVHGVHPGFVSGHFLLFLKHASGLLRASSYRGPLSITVAFEGIRGVPWIHFPHGEATPGPFSVVDDSFSFIFSASTDSLEPADQLVKNLIESTLFGVNLWNWATEDQIATLVRWGYEYNQW